MKTWTWNGPVDEADIVPGAVFPDYELSDHRGKHRTLSELQGGDPLVVVLARGGFCPKDRRQHEGGQGREAGFYPYGKTQAQVLAERE